MSAILYHRAKLFFHTTRAGLLLFVQQHDQFDTNNVCVCVFAIYHGRQGTPALPSKT